MQGDALQTDLARSFDETIERAAHRNEVRLAWIRAVHLSVALLAILVFRGWPRLVGMAALPSSICIAAVFWTLVAWGIVLSERGRGYRTWIPWATTFVDLAMILTFRVLAVTFPGRSVPDRWTELISNGLSLFLIPRRAGQAAEGHGGAGITLVVHDIERKKAILESRGASFIGDVIDAEKLSLAIFEDPDANPIYLVEENDLAIESTGGAL
jgi:hypothetical protein